LEYFRLVVGDDFLGEIDCFLEMGLVFICFIGLKLWVIGESVKDFFFLNVLARGGYLRRGFVCFVALIIGVYFVLEVILILLIIVIVNTVYWVLFIFNKIIFPGLAFAYYRDWKYFLSREGKLVEV